MDEEYFEGSFDKPGWVKDPETGELLSIERDQKFHEALSQFYQAECSHPEPIPMLVKIADGREQVYRCCTLCGERVGTALSQKDRNWVTSLKELPAELVHSYASRRKKEKRALLLRLAREQFAERGRSTKAYQQYIASPEWKAMRDKIFERCGGLCEGCREQPAVEVHHLSYRHFMAEFLFELAGLCHECHERWHASESVAAKEINEGKR